MDTDKHRLKTEITEREGTPEENFSLRLSAFSAPPRLFYNFSESFSESVSIRVYP
jgi:hypothetical protein